MTINYYRSIKDSNNEVKNLTEILESIQDATYKYQIDKLRDFKNNDEEENASKLKQSLPVKASKNKTPRFLEGFLKGGRPVSNRRPLEPQSSALTN